MSRKVFIVGVSTTKFYEVNTGGDYPEFGKSAVENALEDAGIKYEHIDQAVCCYVFGKSCAGQRVLYQVGMTGIPIHNIGNNGASGSTGLFLGKQLVEGNIANAVLVLGFEKTGPLKAKLTEMSSPLIKHAKTLEQMKKVETGDIQTQIYANAGLEHMKKFGVTKLQVSKVAAKNHRHGAKNPHSVTRTVYNVDEILDSRKIHGPLTKLETASNSDGAAAVVLMSENAVVKYGLQDRAIEIVGMEMATDTADLFTSKSCVTLAGNDMTALAAKRLYHKTRISPRDIDVVELHDSFATNEIISYESLQLCGVGEAGRFIDDGDNTYGGRVVVNPSGGTIARGHPVGATGVAQCAELVWQLRGEAGDRQVPNADLALQHNQGLGGATVIAIYKKGFSSHVLV